MFPATSLSAAEQQGILLKKTSNGASLKLLSLFSLHAYLTGPEDDPVVVLLTTLFVFVQLLPPQTHCNRAQVLVHTQVIPVF